MVDRRQHWVCLLLAFVGGFADAGSFVLVGGFTGHITGNGVLAAVHLTAGEVALTVWSAVAVVAFLCGTAAGIKWKEDLDLGSRLVWPLVTEMTLIAVGLVALGLGLGLGRALFVACACFSLGLQNGVLDKSGAVSVHSTYMTGMSTSLVGAVLDRKALERKVLTQVIACFLLGATCGAALSAKLGAVGCACILLPLLIALVLSAQMRPPSGAE